MLNLQPRYALIEVPYRKELVAIREVLENVFPLFPTNFCNHANDLVQRVLGLEKLSGDFIYWAQPKEREDIALGDKESHSWNYDPKRKLYVDITQDQFDPNLPKITLMHEDTNVLVPNIETTRRSQELLIPKYPGGIESLCQEIKKKIPMIN